MGVKIWVDRWHGGKIYLSIYENGRQVRESTGLTVTEDKRQNAEIMRMAEILRSKKELQIVANRNGMASPDQKNITLAEYTQAHIKETRSPLMEKVLPYTEQYGGGIRITAITPTWFENFQLRIQHDTKLAATTAERYCCCVRELLKKACRAGIIPQDPSSGIKHIRVPESKRPFLDTDEIRQLVRTPIGGELGQEVRQGFLFAICTGLRVSDIQTLTWGDVDVSRRQIVKRQKKTQNIVYIPLKDEAWQLINDATIHAAAEYVFPRLATTKTNTDQYLVKWGKDAGLSKRVTWHVARHTMATQLIESGADLYTVQRTLGHTKLGTTAQYAKVTDHKKREAVEALPEYGIAGD